jgi:hypothetical protein
LDLLISVFLTLNTTLVVRMKIMKKFILASFIFAASSLSLFAIETDRQVVDINTLTQSDLDAFSSQEDGSVVIEFPAGTILPLKFFFRGGLITLVGEEKEIGQVKVEKTLYLRCLKEEEFLLSSDCMNWKSLLEFITGNATMELKIEESGPAISFGADVEERG